MRRRVLLKPKGIIIRRVKMSIRNFKYYEFPSCPHLLEIFEKLLHTPHSFLLNHGAKHCVSIGLKPRFWIKAFSHGMERNGEFIPSHPLSVLDALIKEHIQFNKETMNQEQFKSGFAGYLNYDLGKLYYTIPSYAKDDLNMPLYEFGYYTSILHYDYKKNKMTLIYEEKGDIDEWRAYLEPCSQEITNKDGFVSDRNIAWNMTREQYQHCIDRIKHYLKEGDIYQVNFARRLQVQGSKLDFLELFPKIIAEPHGAYLNTPPFHILSFSMERLFKVNGNHIMTQPIKGTVAKDVDPLIDAKNRKWLENSAKNAAEHVMIVDLERNDLSRVCRAGKVKVPEFKKLHTYFSVHHLVSTVKGKLEKEVSFMDVLQAFFPGGSITGAPKLSAQKIIEELEPVRRGLYTGSIGFIDVSGYCDFNIAIRTLIHTGQTHYYSVGGGIVYDSNWEEEYKETLDKSTIVLEYLNRSL